jgi:membrane protein YdbS with pleckstrin-like domain
MIIQNTPNHLGTRTLFYLILSKASFALKLIVLMVVITFCMNYWSQNIAAFEKSKEYFLIPHYFAISLHYILTYGWVLSGALFVCLGIAGLLEYNSIKFTLTNSALTVSSGMMSHKELTIPFAQVDTMNITDNPTLRMFGLCSFVIKTSAQNIAQGTKTNPESDSTFPVIPITLAKELQEKILAVSGGVKTNQVVS